MSRQALRKINKDRAANSAKRRARMLMLEAKGKSIAEIAGEIGVARKTVFNNLLRARQERGEATPEVRKNADDELRALKDFALQSTEMTDKEIVDAVRGIWQDLARLHGANAPTRNENLNLTGDLESLGPYRQFVLACRGLDQEQVDQLLTLAREMPRKPAPMAQPPKTSPLWENKQLEVGDATS